MGPYKEDGSVWSACEVDLCNGLYIGEEYVYVTTIFYPYTVACFSRGSWASFYPKCTKNPRSCGASSSYYIQEKSILIVLAFASLINLLIQWWGMTKHHKRCKSFDKHKLFYILYWQNDIFIL